MDSEQDYIFSSSKTAFSQLKTMRFILAYGGLAVILYFAKSLSIEPIWLVIGTYLLGSTAAED